MSTYKCENKECGNVFRSNNPLSCPKCDTLEFSTVHIESNKYLLVFGFLILFIGAGFVYLKNDFQTTKVANLFQIEVNDSTCERVIISADNLSMNYAVSVDRNEGYTLGKMNWNVKEITNNKIFYIKDVSTKEIIELTILKCKIKESKLVSKNNNEENISEKLILKIEQSKEITTVSSDVTLVNTDLLSKKELLKIGQKQYGGIIFYIDQTGKHGLVAAIEDLSEGSTDPYGWGFNGYEWGCFDEYVKGSDETFIGAGYQNTLDIVNQGCTTENGGVTAAQATIAYKSHGYDDWFLPSKDELKEMYLTIGKGSENGNIGRFENGRYWSSSEVNGYGVDIVEFDKNGYSQNLLEQLTFRVRAIRAF